jgi:hypothetical protein
MDFGLSEDQLLKDTVKRFLAEQCPRRASPIMEADGERTQLWKLAVSSASPA